MKTGIFGSGFLHAAIVSLLEHEGNFDVVVKNCTDIREFVSQLRATSAAVAFIPRSAVEDSDLEFMGGARAYGDFRIVLLVDKGDHREIKSSWAIDVVIKDDADVLLSLRQMRGAASQVAVRSARPRDGRSQGYNSEFELTRREFEVASLVSKGFSNRRIATVTDLREQSIKNLVSVIMRKLKCENRVQVALRLTHAVIGDDTAEPHAALEA